MRVSRDTYSLSSSPWQKNILDSQSPSEIFDSRLRFSLESATWRRNLPLRIDDAIYPLHGGYDEGRRPSVALPSFYPLKLYDAGRRNAPPAE